MSLLVHEIYRSIQGETSRIGLPVTIIRLAGCNLSCRWCDTPQAELRSRSMSVQEVVDEAAVLSEARRGVDIGHYLVTGGEPLLQAELPELLRGLLAKGSEVLVETNGSLDVRVLDHRAVRILDIKGPGSGMIEHNRWENLEQLRPFDELKLVLADRRDYEWACALLDEHQLPARCHVLLSPACGLLDPKLLAKWICEDRLPVRFQLQLHKLIWGPWAQGV